MSSLAPGLLVAAPALTDPNFSRSVVLLAAHGEDGAFGWVLNGRRLMSLAELVTHTEMKCDAIQSEGSVHLGGPVGQGQVWLLYRTEERPAQISDEHQFDLGIGITASTSQKVLEAMTRGKAPPSLRGVMGFANWEPWQLENEIRIGAWLPTDAEASLVFDASLDDIWDLAYRRVGASPMAFGALHLGAAARTIGSA
jgi:putative transcriptional regulator